LSMQGKEVMPIFFWEPFAQTWLVLFLSRTQELEE
jgi:hypothetical protein